MNTVPRDFYNRSTLQVARDLLGKTLYRKTPEGIISGKIVETEAYLCNDAACHASRGKTPRNEIMFGPPGHFYVYFTYGMHYCMNLVTKPEGTAEAVLIRAVEPIKGIELMKKYRQKELKNLTNGPAKVCQAFNITKEHNGVDATKGSFKILDCEKPAKIFKAPRIGINQNTDKLWRFYTDSVYVSKK